MSDYGTGPIMRLLPMIREFNEQARRDLVEVSGADEATAEAKGTAELPRGQSAGAGTPAGGPLLAAWEPVGHRPPLPRIETAPRYTQEPQLIPEHLRIQIEHAERMDRLKVGERIWAHVVEIAKGG